MKIAFDYRWSLLAGAASFLVTIYLVLSNDSGYDFVIFLYLLFLLPVLTALTTIIMLIVAWFKKRWPQAAFSAVLVYWLIAIAILPFEDSLREHLRWMLHASMFKQQFQVKAQAAPGELRHMEWDGTGMIGQETSIQLVFDPENRLAPFAHKSRVKVAGIPCEVPEIRRLESHWYSVTLYTNTDWEHCG
jgi:hypothetical protein